MSAKALGDLAETMHTDAVPNVLLTHRLCECPQETDTFFFIHDKF